ncbi:MAG: ABC transporter ATP-binding protein, partial [Monoglobales bacterium]
REDYENAKLRNANNAFKNANIKANDVARKYGPYMGKMQTLFTIYIIIVGGIMVINGKMTVGEIVMFNSMIWMVTSPLSMFSGFINEFSNITASGEKLNEFLNEEPEITNKPMVKKDRLVGNIAFEHVSFDYEGEGALRGVSFRIDRGQKIGIVGSTGSGKSTVINLIDRFYDATGGRVLIDGEDIRKIDLELLRNSVSVSQQDVFLFSESIAKNIAYGHPAAKMEDIIRAAKIAKAHDFISKLPEGYDTIIGERGLGLSGGQKQRITLARAILKNPSILILDDTTSALDADTEKYIWQQIKKHLKGKTVIIISQRISSVSDCDQIFVFEDGKITERGTHSELVRHKGYYYNIYMQQHGTQKRVAEVQYNG